MVWDGKPFQPRDATLPARVESWQEAQAHPRVCNSPQARADGSRPRADNLRDSPQTSDSAQECFVESRLPKWHDVRSPSASGGPQSARPVATEQTSRRELLHQGEVDEHSARE